MEQEVVNISELVEGNLKLIGFFVKRYKIPDGITYDEYHSELMLALYRSAQGWNPKLAKFSTYAIRGMVYARMWILTNKKLKKNKNLSLHDGNMPNEPSFVENKMAGLELEENRSLIKKMLGMVNEEQRQVLSLTLRGDSPTEIAKAMGITKKKVNDAMFRAKRFLRRYADELGVKIDGEQP